jgi:addiction module RelE/StbE family toxin
MEDLSYILKFTPKAEEDLDEIYNYISPNLSAIAAADNLMNNIEYAIMRLKEFPLSCGHVLDESLKNRGYRKLIIENYIVSYLVNEFEKQVVIMRILYEASYYTTIL